MVLGGVLVAFAACGSVATSPTGDCAQRGGSYLFKLTERPGGGCEKSAQSVVMESNAATTPDPPCVGTLRYSRDNCQQSIDAVCPYNGKPGYHIATLGVVTWNHDSTHATGTIEVTETSETGSVYCKGTYDAEKIAQ